MKIVTPIVSSTEPKDHKEYPNGPAFVRPSIHHPKCLNIFKETAWPIKAKFYVEPPWVGGTKFVRSIRVT